MLLLRCALLVVRGLLFVVAAALSGAVERTAVDELLFVVDVPRVFAVAAPRLLPSDKVAFPSFPICSTLLSPVLLRDVDPPLTDVAVPRVLFLFTVVSRLVAVLFVEAAVLLLVLPGLYKDTDLLSTRDAPGRSACLMLLTVTARPVLRSISLREGPP